MAERPESGRGARRVAQAIARLCLSRPWAVVLVALLVGGLSVATASGLRIDQRLRVLLPDHFPSIVRLDASSERLGNQDDLLVTIRSPDREANIGFGRALETALKQRDDMRWVIFYRDRTFFEDKALLYADLDDLLDLRRRVIERIQARVRKEFSVLDGAAKKEEQPPLDEEIEEQAKLDERLPEYFEADEGRLMVLKARPDRPSSDVGYARRLGTEVQAAVASLEPTSHHPEMTVRVDGSYAQHSKRVRNLQTDVISGSAAAVGLLLLSIGLYFRQARAVVLVLVPLFVAVFAALAFARLYFGALNLVSAFIFAVLLGLGIDFGIHILARYRDERRRGASLEDGIRVTLQTAGMSTSAGAASTALAFFLLGVAEFQGFSQFGLVAGVGVVLAIVAALVVMPALLVAMERLRPWNIPPVLERSRPDGEPSGARFPRWAAAAAVVAGLGGAALSAAAVPNIPFEYDFNALGPVKPPRTGPKPVSYRDAVGQAATVAPALALTDDLEEAWSVHVQLQTLLDWTPEQLASFVAGTMPVREPVAAKPEPEPEPGQGPKPAAGDDWDSWVDEDDDLDAPPGGDEDPVFTAMQARVDAGGALDPQTAELLGQYPPQRLADMHDRIFGMFSIFRFVPTEQADKLLVIQDIRRRIDDKRAILTDEEKEDLDRWYAKLQVDRAVTLEDLPDWVHDQFKDAEGRSGRFVVIWTRGSKADFLNSKRIYDAFFDVQTPDRAVPVAADFFVIPEIMAAIRSDGPVVVSLTFSVLALTALILLRSFRGALLVLWTVVVALAWLAGVMAALDWKVNFFNIIALPLLVGMGQDDALHLMHRYEEEGPGRMGTVVRETGGAIFLTTVTTVFGFGGILFANHRGLLSLAWVAVIGMSLLLVSSVLILPATLRLLDGAGEARRRAGR